MTDHCFDPDSAAYFVTATREYESEELFNDLWCQAIALAEGSETRAKYIYIQLRAKQLMNTHSIEEENGELISNTSHTLSWADEDRTSVIRPTTAPSFEERERYSTHIEENRKCYSCYGSGYAKGGKVCSWCRGSGLENHKSDVIMKKDKPSTLPSEMAREKMVDNDYDCGGGPEDLPQDDDRSDEIHDNSMDLDPY